MPQLLRKNIAKSLSGIELPETYLVHRKIAPANTEQIKDPGFVHFVEDTGDIIIQLGKGKDVFSARFDKGKKNGVEKRIVFSETSTVPRFFKISEGRVDKEIIEMLKAEYYDLSDILMMAESGELSGPEYLMNPARTYKFENGFTSPPVVYIFSSLNISVETHEVEILDTVRNIYKVSCDIREPETEDILASLKPEIIKLDLLSPAEWLNNADTSIHKIEIEPVDLDVPEVRSDINLDFSSPLKQKYFSNFSIDLGNIIRIETPALDFNNAKVEVTAALDLGISEFETNALPNLIQEPILNSSDKQVYKMLEPVYELTDEIKNSMLSVLPDYQQVGAATLADSNLALFYDEQELGKEVQTILALKMLLRIRAAKRILIVSSKEKNKIVDPSGNLKTTGVWQSYIKTLLHEFDFSFYTKAGSLTSTDVFGNNVVIGLSYEVFEESFLLGSLTPERLNIFDCVIFDDTSEETLQLDAMKNLGGGIDAEYIWFLSDFFNSKLQEKLKTLFPNKSLTSFGRCRTEIESELPRRYCYDYLVSLDLTHRETAAQIYSEGKEKIDDLIGLGNIFRIQPNVFQILQDFQRRTNFINGSSEGKKADLLRYNLARALDRNDRALVYTQYDEHGLQLILNLLENLEYDFIAFRNTDSQIEIEEKIESAKNTVGKLVYVTNLKPNAIKFKFPNVNQLINFDNWCIPATRWAIESKMDQGDSPSITVYNYYFERTIESKLFADLTARGLWDKNFAENIPAEKIYELLDEKYWTDFFELINIDMTKEVLQEEDTGKYQFNNVADMAEAVKNIVEKLGYREVVTFSDQRDCTYHVSGKIVIDDKVHKLNSVCIHTDFLNSETLREILAEVNCTPGSCRIFIITNGIISRSKIVLPSNVSLVDGKRLKSYLSLF